MSSRLESWYVAQASARLTADGCCQVNVPPAGVWPGTPIGFTAGEYRTFDAVALQLQARLQAAFPAAGFAVTAGTDFLWISAGVNFDFRWTDTELQEYCGYVTTEFFNTALIQSTAGPGGRFTSAHALVPEWWDELIGRRDTAHTGEGTGYFLARRQGQRCTLPLAGTEISRFGPFARRLALGIPARVWVASTGAATFAWTAAGWTGGRDLALYDPRRATDFGRWLTAPWTALREIEFDLAEVA